MVIPSTVYVLFRLHAQEIRRRGATEREQLEGPQNNVIEKESEDFHRAFLRDLADGLLQKNSATSNPVRRAAPTQKLSKRSRCKICPKDYSGPSRVGPNRTRVVCATCKEPVCNIHFVAICQTCKNNTT